MNNLYNSLLREITNFVQNTKEISCLALIGSQVSSNNKSDDYSDIDLLIVTNKTDFFYSNDVWLKEIDEMWITFTESAPDAFFYERRVIFKNGLDVDFVLVDEDILVSDSNQLPLLKAICREKISIIIDKKDIKKYLNSFVKPGRSFELPTQWEFSNLTNDFYFHYLWCYKKILRGEYWVALQCLNSYLKSKILTMLEWYEHSYNGINYNTYYEGRHIEKWLSKEFCCRFNELFSRYEPGELKSVLKKNIDFFTEISIETAEMNNLTFEEEGKDKLIKWIDNNYQ